MVKGRTNGTKLRYRLVSPIIKLQAVNGLLVYRQLRVVVPFKTPPLPN